MRRIYIGHSRSFDYENELYKVVKELEEYKDYEFILPHDMGNNDYFGRDFYKSLDLFIGEVSYGATGLGIELGWVYDDGIPIYYIYKDGVRISNSIKGLSDKFYVYSDLESLKEVLRNIIDDWEHNNGSKEV